MGSPTENEGIGMRSTYVMTKKNRKLKNVSGSVYAIRIIGTDFVKIGCSRAWYKRIEQLGENAQHHLGIDKNSKMELICTFESDDMYTDEEALHIAFSTKRLAGEWFVFDTIDLNIIQIVFANKAFHVTKNATQEQIDRWQIPDEVYA